MNTWKRIKLSYNFITRRWKSMTLVFILGLEMGLITKEQIHPTDLELVEKALNNIGRIDLLN